jgi:hypothetical protein
MKSISYLNTNENVFLFSDPELNIVENWELVEYNENGNDPLVINNISTSFNDQYILYKYNYVGELSDTRDLYDIDQLNIMSYDRLRRGDFQNNIFKFRTDEDIMDIIVSKYRNHVAVVFTVVDIYSVFMNGEVARYPLNRNDTEGKIFLHVYDFTEGNSRLILNKEYNRFIKVALSGIDTIAIDYGDCNQHNKIFEIYDLNTGNNILTVNDQSIINFNILCMQYFPTTEQLPNHLLLITFDMQQIIQMRVINLQVSFIEIFRNNVDDIIRSIDISRNGHIGLAGANGLLFYNSFGVEAVHLYQGHYISDLSFSLSGDNIAVSINNFNEIHQELTPSVSVYNIIYQNTLFTYDEEDEDEEWEDLDGEDEEEEDIVIDDPELDACFIPSTDPQKLAQYGNKNCFDTIQLNEEQIGEYLSEDRDNIVIFYKQPNDPDFLATCLTFTGLKKYLKDPKHVFYRCAEIKDPRTYYTQRPEFLKIPTQTHTIFVSYQDMKAKYMQRQNMIFLEHSGKVERTITYDASFNMAFVSGNHCQDGSVIDVYRIIF